MKTLHKICLAAAIAFVPAACTNDFLEVENPTAEPVEEYFTTEEHLMEALVAAYDPLEWTDWSSMAQYDPINLVSEAMADQLWVGGSDKTDNQFLHLMANYEATPNICLTAIWTIAYSGIKRCNDVISYIGNVEGLSEETAKSYEAQVRVLRAFYYTWLWKFWGNVPYYEENLKSPFTAEQTPADQVYENLMTDLQGAIDLGALPMKCSDADAGHITKAMAYMLYAEDAMYKNDKERLPKALSYMKEIIASGEYSLTPDYGDIFKNEGEWNDESIFEITYKSEGAVRGWSWANGAGGTVIPRLISPKDWGGDSDHDQGWGFFPVRTETYEMYSEGDARREATCFDARNTGSGKYTARYQDTGYFLEKYIAYVANREGALSDADFGFNNNIRYYRYSETLLNAAELVVEGYGDGDAESWLNAVHSRAIAGETVTLSLDNIKQERRLEFVGEGKRYWDLVRWGDAPTVLVPDSYGYRTNTWSESKRYLPIPQSEIDATAGTSHPLTQNNY